MSFSSSGIGGSPYSPTRADVRVSPGQEELRRTVRSSTLGAGTLACARCDAPVFISEAVAPADRLTCPYCAHSGTVREFLSLAPPLRPARVVVRVRARS